MVAAYVETLLEELTGAEKMVPDQDGDYPVRFGDALYYVRIAGAAERPVIQVFSVALAEVEATPKLFEELNNINTQLHFCRCFWVRGQVLFETEHLGETISPPDFKELVVGVAGASDYFGPKLADQFGGKLLFEESKGETYPGGDAAPYFGGYL